MTVGDLYREVSQLGFETSLDDGTLRFYQALNRCLLQASKVKPVVKRVQIPHYRPKNLLPYCEREYINVGDDIVFEAVGALSYYFEASGKASYKLEKFFDGDWETIGSPKTTERSIEYKQYGGTIDGIGREDRVRIVFSGDYLFTVRNVAFYAQKLGDKELAMNPDYTEYDFSKMYSDFGGFALDPTVEGYSIIRQNTLCIPSSYQGIVTVEYEHRPYSVAFTFDPEEDEEPVDADEEICSILPYLVASYVWIDDEPEKAQYYKVMYEERAQEIRSRLTVQTPIKINNHGW